MKLNNQTIVITGGTTGIGIGFALAQQLIEMGNQVIAVDFNEQNIQTAQQNEPRLHVIQADLITASAREQLVEELNAKFPDYSVLINNAGIQRWINLQNAHKDWSYYQQELQIDFEAPMHLSILTLDHLLHQSDAAIVNVSSGLVINPGVWVPFYTAGKTGLHGFTEFLRLQVDATGLKVFEILPPAVNTSLGGSNEHSYGSDLADFIPAVISQLENDVPHITFDTSTEQLNATKAENDERTKQTWAMFKDNPTYLD